MEIDVLKLSNLVFGFISGWFFTNMHQMFWKLDLNLQIDFTVSLPLQESRSTGAALTLSAPWSAEIQVSHGISSGLTSMSTGEFKWASAIVDDSPERPRWSVTWTWNLLRWDDGQSFDPNRPGKLTGWSLPEVKGLPTLSLAAVEHNWAEWSTSSGLEGMEKMEWDVEVKFHTVLLKRHVLKSGKEWVSPEQIAPIKGKISGVAISSVSFPLL